MTSKTLAAWTGTAMLALVSGGQAVAGEFQLGMRLGTTKVTIDGEQLTSGESLHDSLVHLGLTAAYRWTPGAFVELGHTGSTNLFSGTDVGHDWLGAGWQFDTSPHWRISPRIGLAFTHLTSTGELFVWDDVDVDRNDTVPYAELVAEFRFGRHFGAGVYTRYNFEDWGSSYSSGLMISWTFNPPPR